METTVPRSITAGPFYTVTLLIVSCDLRCGKPGNTPPPYTPRNGGRSNTEVLKLHQTVCFDEWWNGGCPFRCKGQLLSQVLGLKTHRHCTLPLPLPAPRQRGPVNEPSVNLKVMADTTVVIFLFCFAIHCKSAWSVMSVTTIYVVFLRPFDGKDFAFNGVIMSFGVVQFSTHTDDRKLLSILFSFQTD